MPYLQADLWGINDASPPSMDQLKEPCLLSTPSEPPLSINLHYRTRPRRLCKTNCRAIEIPILYPSRMLGAAPMDEQRVSETMLPSSEQPESPSHDTDASNFPFLKLPLELRLKIYSLLLPARSHTLVTQYPHNGYNYFMPPSYASQTLYPAASSTSGQPPSHKSNEPPQLTTYKLLNANFRRDFPNPSICPEILRVCKQIHAEAEPVLYGSTTVFDFGTYVDAIVPFLTDRSEVARKSIRSLKVAREIPRYVSSVVEDGDRQRLRGLEDSIENAVDPLWARVCRYLREHCIGLRTVDLTVWAESGSGAALPEVPSLSHSEAGNDGELGSKDNENQDNEMRWREWEWTRGLLKVEGLRHVKVTWWGFEPEKGGVGRFDSWLGRRMVADKLVRDRMVWEGCVVEGVIVVPGDWKSTAWIG